MVVDVIITCPYCGTVTEGETSAERYIFKCGGCQLIYPIRDLDRPVTGPEINVSDERYRQDAELGRVVREAWLSNPPIKTQQQDAVYKAATDQISRELGKALRRQWW